MMPSPRRDRRAGGRQAGMSTVIVVVVLLLIVLAGLLAALRRSGADFIDTALNNDAVEALFLAESGVARAGARLGGVGCAGLAPDGPVNLGRGSFTLVAAATVGGECRVRVAGRVGSVTRTIEADFTSGFAEHFPTPPPPLIPPPTPTGWTATESNGAGFGGWDNVIYGNAPGSTPLTGSVYVTSDPNGDNDRYRYRIERSLGAGSFVAAAGMPIALDFLWRKTNDNPAGTRPHLIQISVRSSSGGPTQVLWSNDTRVTAPWTQVSIAPLPVGGLVGRTVDTLEIFFDLRENNVGPNPDYQVEAGVDFITFGGSTAIRDWHEVVN
ncbi:MAG TPA: hypothetical protein VGA00_13965 [Acidiferrobacterales bacterium]